MASDTLRLAEALTLIEQLRQENQALRAIIAALEQRVADLAARVWPGQNPIGKKFHHGDQSSPLWEVIGVATNVRSSGLQKAPTATAYFPYWQRDDRNVSLAIRTTMDPAAITSAVREEIRKLDRDLPVPKFLTMREIVSASVAQRRFQLNMVMAFAGIEETRRLYDLAVEEHYRFYSFGDAMLIL